MMMLSVMFYRPKEWARTRMRRCPHAVHGLVQKSFATEFIRFCKSMKVSFAFMAPDSITEKSIKEKASILILMYLGADEGSEMTVEKAMKVLAFFTRKKISIRCFGYGDTPDLSEEMLMTDSELASRINGTSDTLKGLN